MLDGKTVASRSGVISWIAKLLGCPRQVDAHGGLQMHNLDAEGRVPLVGVLVVNSESQ